MFPSERGEAWLTIENDRIVSESLVITEAISESENLEFGSCNANKMEIVVADVAEDVTGREFTLTVEIGGYEMAMGIYTVESFVRQADRRKRKLTAHDRMRWFDVDVSSWYNELSFPMTLKSFRDSLCAYIGIQQFATTLPLDSMQVTKTIEPEQISGRDVLKAICQINGCFGHVDKTGELKYIQLQQTGLYPSEDLFPAEDLYPAEFGGDGEPVEIIDYYKKLTYEDYLVDGITGVIIRQQEGDIGANVGTGENPYAIEGNFLVYGKSPVELLSIATTILDIISERTYCPSSLECNAMPWVEVGDAIRAITRDDLVETFVMNRVTKGCQAMVDQISSTGAKSREESFGIHQQIIQLEGKAAIITKNVEEVSVRVTEEVDRATKEEAAIRVESGKIDARVTQLAYDTIDGNNPKSLSSRITLTADKLETEVLSTTNKSSLSSKITQQAGEIALRVKSKEIVGTLNSELKVAGNSIELTTGHFTVDSKNLKLNDSGNATFSGTVQSAEIKTSTITGGSISISGTNGGKNYSFGVNTNGQLSWASANSSMSSTGVLTCDSGKFTGEIVANTGKIGGTNGFTIATDKIYSGNKSNLSSTANGVYIGTDGISLGNKFKVTNVGDMTVSNITLSGGVIAPKYDSNGKLIGGWKVTSSGLEGVSMGTEIHGGNIKTPSLLVELGRNTVFSATANDTSGEIIAYYDIDMKNHSLRNLKGLKVETEYWDMRPYSGDVGEILDAIWIATQSSEYGFSGLNELKAHIVQINEDIDSLWDAVSGNR